MKYLFYAALVLLVVPLQIAVSDRVSIGGIRPDLALVLVCLIGLGACGSSDNHPAVVEISTQPDGSADGKGGSAGSADVDSSLEVSVASDTSSYMTGADS